MKEDKHNREKTISIEEYNKHIDMLKFIDTTRNTLLTFAFTSVLAVVGYSDWDRKGKIQSMVVSAAVFSDHTVYGPDIILQTFLCAYKQFSGSVCRRQDVFYERNKGRAGTLWARV